ncbi:MAG TPA: hypothetical protein VFW33_22670 [Gemmataceae bacterium]|nr:hypothetical protein [Gemmataceae bacterium]
MATASASTTPTDRTKRRRRLLYLAAGLFAAWIAYLAFLALTTGHPTVLSRPQFLVADVWAVAEVEDLGKPIKVVEVAYAKGEAPEKGSTIEVGNLSACKEDWKGPGRYIVPLTRDGTAYRVPAVPRSPGYGPPVPQFHIYPDTGETRAQLDHLPRPK